MTNLFDNCVVDDVVIVVFENKFNGEKKEVETTIINTNRLGGITTKNYYSFDKNGNQLGGLSFPIKVSAYVKGNENDN